MKLEHGFAANKNTANKAGQGTPDAIRSQMSFSNGAATSPAMRFYVYVSLFLFAFQHVHTVCQFADEYNAKHTQTCDSNKMQASFF